MTVLILTRTMIKVLQAAADGENVESTAAVLGVKKGTVHKHRAKLMKRMGADNMVHAVAMGMRRGYIT